MNFAFQILPHPNPYYDMAVGKLARMELAAMLDAADCSCVIGEAAIGGSLFLTFEADSLSPGLLRAIARHSSLLLCAEFVNDCLRPIDLPREHMFPHSLADIPRYKGKTGASFTRMMISCALAAGRLDPEKKALRLLDPVCGRGTSLLCAAELGINSVGIDSNRAELRECMTYFERYLERQKCKYSLVQSSRTAGNVPVPDAENTFAVSKDDWRAGRTCSLRLLCGDSGLAGKLLNKNRADLIVADLPYGVQHAPQSRAYGRTEDLTLMLRRVLPSWREAAVPGAPVAISFNSLTMPRERLLGILEVSGFRPLTDPPYGSCAHRLEQAVVRDLVLAVTI